VLFWVAAAFIRVMGNQVLTMKVAVLSVNLAFVGVTTALAWSVTRQRAATLWTALFAFGFSAWQGYLEGYNSVFIMATLATVAMWLAVIGRGRWPLLLLSGVALALALSFFTKQVMIFEAFAAMAFAVAYAPTEKRWLSVAWVVGGGLLGVLVVVLWTVWRGNLYDLWYGSFYTGLLYSFEPEGSRWHFNTEFFTFFRRYFMQQTLPFIGGLLLLSVPAGVVAWRSAETRPATRIVLLWLLGALLGASIGRSLRRQYYIELIPALLLLNALAAVCYTRWRLAWRVGLLVGVLAVSAWNVRWQGVRLPQTLAWQSPNIITNGDGLTTNALAERVVAELPPEGCIWNWDGLGYLNYLADRGSCTSAPHGAALMVKESFNIDLNRAEYLRELFAAQPTLHVRQPIWGYFPELERFAERYRGEQLITLADSGGFIEVYRVDMQHYWPIQATFAAGFGLIGWDADIPDTGICAGDMLDIALTWQVDTPPTRYYNTFVHLLTADQTATVVNFNAQPHPTMPTLNWTTVGMVYLSDTWALTVPADTAAGDYKLVHGFYDTETLERVPVFGADGLPLAGDYILLETVTVLPEDGCTAR